MNEELPSLPKHTCVACGAETINHFIGSPTLCNDCIQKVTKWSRSREFWEQYTIRKDYPPMRDYAEVADPDLAYIMNGLAESIAKTHLQLRNAEIGLYNLGSSLQKFKGWKPFCFGDYQGVGEDQCAECPYSFDCSRKTKGGN